MIKAISRKILYILALFCIPLSSYVASVPKADELKPRIGNIEDSGRVDPNEFEFSDAEMKLWLENHLANITRPARLYYEFIRAGSYEDGFTDAVYLDVLRLNDDGSKDTELEFFTEERRQQAFANNLKKITGNPIIGIYLQGDIQEMSRLTGGNWRYFQKQIKFAFADEYIIEPVTIEYEGKQIAAEKISITPYLKEKNPNRLKGFFAKRYEFILSDAILGGVYQIKTETPDKKNPDKPLIIETLTLRHVQFRDKI